MLIPSSSLTSMAGTDTVQTVGETEAGTETPADADNRNSTADTHTEEEIGMELPVETGIPQEAGTPEETQPESHPQEEVSQQIALTGTVTLAKEAGPAAAPNILVRFYDAAAYDKNADTHPCTAEALTNEYGIYEVKLMPGVYRVEYLNHNEQFLPEQYTIAELPEDAGYEILMAAEEQEEEKPLLSEADSYFACIRNIEIQEAGILDIPLVEKKDDEQTTEISKEETPTQPEQSTQDTGGMTGAETAPETSVPTGTATPPETETAPDTENVPDTDAATETPSETDERTDEENVPDTVPGEDKEAEIVPESSSVDEKANYTEKENEEDFSGLMPVSQLFQLDEEIAGATMEKKPQNIFRRFLRAVSGDTWSFDAYYVNQKDKYHVEKDGDFNLKYQMEFHASEDIDSNHVLIRIPEELFKYRDGTSIVPTDIAVPMGTPEEYHESRSTPFNYYREDSNLVFFNYKKITSGTNVAFQVLYKNLKIMEITDETEWSLQPSITVKPLNSDEETKETTPLTGVTDSQVWLSSVTKQPYQDSRNSYAPGLYTRSQVKSYISGALPQEYEENFDNYRYVVWDVTIRGSGTQPWNLQIKDSPYVQLSQAGGVVGYKNVIEDPNLDIRFDKELINTGNNYTQLKGFCKEEMWRCRFRVVTAHPKDRVQVGTPLRNTMDVSLIPYDSKDPVQKHSDDAQWSYVDYKWTYRGDIIGVEKYAVNRQKHQMYKGWLTTYKEASKAGQDRGDIPFWTTSQCYGYGYTHYISGQQVGQRIPGAEYEVTTVDDALYAYSSGNTGDAKMLTGEDYYFSGIRVTQRDWGYDVWEDTTAAPEESGSLDIYAKFADTAEDWELVESVPWNNTGILSYEFSGEDIAREPWRVKAVHRGVNYLTTCVIDVNVALKHDSPIMAELLAKYQEAQMITIENISGVMGERFQDNVSQGYFHQTEVGDNNNYNEPGLREFTEQLYGVLLQRDSAFAELTDLNQHAASYKTAKTSNDALNSRALVDYCLTAYDGYEIYGKEGAEYLRDLGLSPGRNQVVFYDLLPYGMKFDPSVPVVAGRITNTVSNLYQVQPKSWDTSQIQVKVDSKKDVIENYRDTGRTMVVFHITYSGADPSVYTQEKWMEGFGVSFRAYYDWKDLDVSQEMANISAFMPEKGDQRPLYGRPSEVALDDGTIVPAGFEKDYRDFGSDINGDGITNIRNVLYARNTAREDIALASTSKIEKLVRADADRFGTYQTSAVTSPGEGYTYDITVSNASNELKDIVVFDRLEYALYDARPATDTMEFDEDCWEGTFSSVVTRGLEEMGIAPVIYYNQTRKAPIPEGQSAQHPSTILTEANGWYTSERWAELGYAMSGVNAVAVDISKKADGTDFILENSKSVTFQIKMSAPQEKQAETYAYNNTSYYSYTEDTNTAATVISNSVRVKLESKERLEVIKQFEGNIPDLVKDWTFEFHLYEVEKGKKKNFANQEYQLWKLGADNQWTQAEDMHATNADGRLSLKAGEKAVFPALADADRVHVEEEENPFWEAEIADTGVDENSVRVVTVSNAYRPVLYVRKMLQAVPEGLDTLEYTFTFQATADGVPMANAEFWYVDSIRTDGGIPSRVTELGNMGIGRTDASGRFQVKEGQIIALFPGKAGTKYEITEVAGAGEDTDWTCRDDSVSGTLAVQGTSASITNIYKWKDLYLTKNITHQNPTDCLQDFTFRITDSEEKAVTGNRWVLLENGEETDTEGILDRNGEFTCACAGKVVKIEKLEAGRTYIVQETESGELYQPVNGGMAEVTMPIYSSKKDASITNDYLKRPLSVSKIVSFDQTDKALADKIAEKDFTMTVCVNGSPLSSYPYTVTAGGSIVRTGNTDEQGRFILRHGQTATFRDAGVKDKDTFEVTETPDSEYHQIYPAANGAHSGTFTGEGNRVTFVNGAPGGLLLSKEYSGADTEGTLYAEETKTNPDTRTKAAVDLTLTVTAGGKTYTWPERNQQVTVIDQLTGAATYETWYADASFRVEPWKSIQIGETQLSGVESYSLEESAGNRHRILEWKDGKWLEISQKEPEDDRPVTGTVSGQPVAVLYNEAKEIRLEGSQIEKRMAIGSGSVPVGAKLVWRAERYDGSLWQPAQGIPYIVFGGGEVVSDRVMETGPDGRIVITKAYYGYPSIKFAEDKVYLNRTTDAQKDDLRLVEVLEESDMAWGTLAGYGNAKDPYAYSMNMSSEEAVAFVNSNWSAPVEIEKRMETESDVNFTMILKQVISASTEVITRPEHILESQTRSGVFYTVYDTATGETVRTGVTGKTGEIRIKAGQYVRLDLPGSQTLWTVSEELHPSYVLKALSGTPESEVIKLSENLMLLRQKAPKIKELSIAGDMRVFDINTGEELNLYSSNVVIPEYVRYQNEICMVTGIADGGFQNWQTLKGIRLPLTLKTIGINAFSGCKYLDGELKIPDGVTSIGVQAFMNCSGLDGGLYIPDSVTSIGSSAFASTGFTGLRLSENLNKISAGTFNRCRKLTGDLVIPDSVENIGADAFYYCDGLDGTLKLSKNLTIIQPSAFQECQKLTGDLEIPDSVESIGECAFENCKNLNGKLTLSGKLTGIEEATFNRCSGLTGDLIIPDGVRNIGKQAFMDCSSLNGELKLSSLLWTIGEEAFKNCGGLNGKLTLPKALMTIGESAFASTGFTGSLEIPSSVTSIGASAFSNCTNFNGTLELSAQLTQIESGVFTNCSGFTGKLELPDGLLSIGNNAFKGCSGFDGNLHLPETLEQIGEMAFYECKKLSGDLTIPDSVGSMGNSVFSQCSGFDGELKLPAGIETIPGDAFSNCRKLQGTLTIPSSVTSIEKNAFASCGKLTGILTIPSSVTQIGSEAFYKCTGFTGLNLQAQITSIERATFDGCTGFRGDLMIPAGVTSIGLCAFQSCGFDGDLFIPNGVKTIGSSAFGLCKGLTGDVSIPASIESIGPDAFRLTYFNRFTINKSQGSISGAPWGYERAEIIWQE